MRASAATLVAVAFLANASLAQAVEGATGTFDGVCPWSLNPELERFSELLADADCESRNAIAADPHIATNVLIVPAPKGPISEGTPAGEHVVSESVYRYDGESRGETLLIVDAYRSFKDAKAGWASKLNTVSQAVGSTQARWFSIGPSVVRNLNATATATAIDYAGSAVSDLPLIALLPALGPVVLLPGNAEYLEQVVGSPGQIKHGGGELAEGVRTGRFDQAAEGFGEVCGGVGVLASVAVPLSAGARAVRPLPRAPIIEKPAATLAAKRSSSVGAAALRKYEVSPKHPAWERGNIGNISKAPKNGQAALENSVEVGDKTRVGIDYETGEFVVFNRTEPFKEIWHGHVRKWEQVRGGTDPLNNQMRSALTKSERTTRNGKIIDAPQWAPEPPARKSGARR